MHFFFYLVASKHNLRVRFQEVYEGYCKGTAQACTVGMYSSAQILDTWNRALAADSAWLANRKFTNSTLILLSKYTPPSREDTSIPRLACETSRPDCPARDHGFRVLGF